MVYLVSYDLNADTGNYAAVYEVIKSFGTQNFTQCLESSWLISTSKSAREVFEMLQTALNKGDRCFITRVNSSEYWGITTSSYNVWEWLQQHLV